MKKQNIYELQKNEREYVSKLILEPKFTFLQADDLNDFQQWTNELPIPSIEFGRKPKCLGNYYIQVPNIIITKLDIEYGGNPFIFGVSGIEKKTGAIPMQWNGEMYPSLDTIVELEQATKIENEWKIDNLRFLFKHYQDHNHEYHIIRTECEALKKGDDTLNTILNRITNFLGKNK